MSTGSRAQVVSSFLTIKGAMIEETYRVFSTWDLAVSPRVNLARMREANSIGARSETWLRDVAKVINRRFDPSGRDRALVQLAQRGMPLHEWSPILLWHMTRDEFLFRDFLLNWLFPAYEDGTFRLRPDAVGAFLSTVHERGGTTEHEWTPTTTERVAASLLRMATEFGLLKGVLVKEFAHYHLPERSFIYLLHVMYEEFGNAARALAAPDWRMFLMAPSVVERECLDLHQYRKLDYQSAGSLVELRLPFRSALEYAESLYA